MKASRLAIPPGQSSRLTESSTVESSARRSTGSTSSPKSPSRRKKSCEPSISKSRHKCPPVLCTKKQAAEESLVYATTKANFHENPSDYELEANGLKLPDCQFPSWADLEGGGETHNDSGGAAGPNWAPSCSDASNSCSSSDCEFDVRWFTSSSTASGSASGSRAHEPREAPKTCSFWEDLISGQRRPWKKLRHKKLFLTHLWDFKTEMKVEESSDPILVSVSVLGSPGPLLLVVDKNDSVKHTVDFALRRYAAQKRQPALADPASCFCLYCLNPDFEALDDEAKIGHWKNRQFHLYHKQRKDLTVDDIALNDSSSCKSGGATQSTPITAWILNNLNAMRSWARNLVAGTSRGVICWVKHLNPRRFYRFIYVSMKALSLGVI
ncbi:unnamed protein product [Calypogeia fissa]